MHTILAEGDASDAMPASLHERVETSADDNTGSSTAIDGALLREAIATLQQDHLPPPLAGAITALAYLMGLIDGDTLVSRCRGHLGGALVEVADRVAFLRGLIAISRELLWRLSASSCQGERHAELGAPASRRLFSGARRYDPPGSSGASSLTHMALRHPG